MLDYFEIPYEKQVVSAHRTPKMMVQFASEARESGIDIIIAGAGGAAHLPARMLSIQNPSLVEKLNHYESSLIQKVEDMQNELQ